ncbi:isochorismate synthase MenF [candidate division KSB1 bacterium]
MAASRKIKSALKNELQKKLKENLHVQVDGSARSRKTIIKRIELDIASIDCITWLKIQDNPLKIYWSDRDQDFEVSGIGSAYSVKGASGLNCTTLFGRINEALPPEYKNMRFYGGIRFNGLHEGSKEWESFGTYRFTIPQFELLCQDNRNIFACNICIDPKINPDTQKRSILEAFDKIEFDTTVEHYRSNKLISREDFPDKKKWRNKIITALKNLDRGGMGKIVLARRSLLTFIRPVDPFDLLYKLKITNPYAYHFCFQIRSGTAFIGGTPELLYVREGEQIQSEAVAGTRSRGRSPEEDNSLEQALLRSEKDLHEHLFVHQSVENSLKKLCTRIHSPRNVTVVKLARVQHLFTKFTGTLKNEISDADIVKELHPTPAVGGHPKDKAIKKIQSLELFDRGWYAGPIGWIGIDKTEFSVAIRSALIRKNKLSLYSGAGIVTGSIPDLEWEEIENKISNFLQILKIHER